MACDPKLQDELDNLDKDALVEILLYKKLPPGASDLLKDFVKGKDGKQKSQCLHCQLKKRASGTKGELIQEISPQVVESFKNKITVVGIGAVGMACAMSLLTQRITNNVCLIDSMEKRLISEMLDLQHGTLFVGTSPLIQASTDYAVSANSKICIVTAGVRPAEGETRLTILQKNAEVMKSIIPRLVKYSPDTILIIVSNPCDPMTWVCSRISGLPTHKVIGAGTNLDTARFRFFLSGKLGIAPDNIHGFIIGEHGDSSVPVWSGVNVAGVYLKDLNKNFATLKDKEKWYELHDKVIDAGYDVVSGKGYTNWAIGLSVANLCYSILRNSGNVHAVTINARGFCGIDYDVYMSLPCVLGLEGVTSVVKMTLSDAEADLLKRSAEILADAQNAIDMSMPEGQSGAGGEN